ncbi:magnesium transporter [Paenibacillus phyllosphaerae]|uniref:Magnesium transport protein CorA n=1 Tax=Paenibacillus phyllosphaerae TaxID=274593 RepID=A0A7W5AWW5_9BACL|nr:magnesium/cobalt transporter CorA [Paenibacillus phyllosphaerae]MBB3109741.1 magnesium transporter [Paenibacillus phyllosphaerae]
MIRTLAITPTHEIVQDLPLSAIAEHDAKWYWVDFAEPTEAEARLLDTHFRFHPLAIEDCLHLLQRPKMDHYEDVHFLVLHAIRADKMAAEEVDLFVGPNFLVTFHHHPSPEIDEAWNRITIRRKGIDKGPLYAAYVVIDKLVDEYFPTLYQLEDQLSEIESNHNHDSTEKLMGQLFEIRANLLKLRRTIVPMRDLLYRIINSERIENMKKHLLYFKDVHDHLLKLTDMLEATRDMTSDMRDNYISVNAHRMNTIMKTLTVITTIFMPLTFIAGLYGMNFANMPELQWRWGYYAVLFVMIALGVGMYAWFRRKGWFK